MNGRIASQHARVHWMFRSASEGSAQLDRTRKLNGCWRWAKAVSVGPTRVTAPCICSSHGPVVKGDGTVFAYSEKASIASSGRLWRKFAFQYAWRPGGNHGSN